MSVIGNKFLSLRKRIAKEYVKHFGGCLCIGRSYGNQAPCLSLIQFQIDNGELVVSAYQRSSDANLGLPSDIYHLYLIARQIDLPLQSITLNLGNVHIYETNLQNTEKLLNGEDGVKFELNV